MKLSTPELIEIAAGCPKDDGFCWCGHCKHVVKLPQHDIDRLETAFAGGLNLRVKCPRCHHHDVRLKFPQVVTPKVKPPVSAERAHELFAQVFMAVRRN
jgi:hypothetical protein